MSERDLLNTFLEKILEKSRRNSLSTTEQAELNNFYLSWQLRPSEEPSPEGSPKIYNQDLLKYLFLGWYISGAVECHTAGENEN